MFRLFSRVGSPVSLRGGILDCRHIFPPAPLPIRLCSSMPSSCDVWAKRTNFCTHIHQTLWIPALMEDRNCTHRTCACKPGTLHPNSPPIPTPPYSSLLTGVPIPHSRLVHTGHPHRGRPGRAVASMDTGAADLSEKDEQLLRLFLSICCHKWQDLLPYSKQSLDCGATMAELLGCVRHICV